MRILYLHQYFVPPDAPGGTRSYEFARRWVQRGHEVTLVTSSAMMPKGSFDPDRITEIDVSGIRVVVLPVPYGNEMGYARRMLAFGQFAAQAAGQVVRHAADVVFATSTPLTIAVPGLLARALRGMPMVFEVRDLWPELPIAIGALRNPVARGLARGLEWAAYHGSAEVVALSPGMADGVAALGIPRDRISVIPNSCDIDAFAVEDADVEAFRRRRLPELKPGQPLVLYGGTFGKINDAGWLVDVAAQMRDVAPEVRFVLAGGGAENTIIAERAKDRGVLGRNLWMLPAIAKNEMPALLGCATVATSLFMPLPQMWNNSANKFFDALAAGKPVAINYGGWQAELLDSTGAGIRLPQADPRAAAHQLGALVRSPERLARCAEAAARIARQRFDRDQLALQLEAVLERAVARHRGLVAAPVNP